MVNCSVKYKNEVLAKFNDNITCDSYKSGT